MTDLVIRGGLVVDGSGAAPFIGDVAIEDGTIAPPPIAALFGLQIREVEVGRVVFECEPDESAYNPIGLVHGGLVCTLADSAAGCAVQSTLEAGVAYTSIDINVTYLRPVTKDTGLIRATARTLAIAAP